LSTHEPEAMLQQFCRDLHLLWRQAGGPSLRTLSGRVRLGKSQLGAVLRGEIRRVPDWDVVNGLIESFRQYAHEHDRMRQVTVRMGINEFWRPRYSVLEHAFSQVPAGGGRLHGPPPSQSEIGPPETGRPGVARREPEQDGWLVVPQQLPPGPRCFVGRVEELAVLTKLADQFGDLAAHGGRAGTDGAVVIVAIQGPPGVGKTALAVRWAHGVADRFIDGQLYVNLRGFGPTGSAVTAAEAVRGFLDALGVPVHRIPVGVEAQAGLYRSLLAGRRVLVVLDNAWDADQVRPLLPGQPGCMVLVTSRNRLTGLVAAEGAHPLTLSLLSTTEARQMLVQHLGPDRVVAEPQAADEIVARCARLPLALAIAAARAVIYPDFSLATLAAELCRSRGDLDALTNGDASSDVRRVFAWSYLTLSDEAARMFRLLGIYRGPDITAPAAASLAGVPPRQAQLTLAELAHAHLISEYAPGRYACHDLLRAYAAELAHVHDSEAERHTADRRTLDHYLHTAHAAARLLDRHRDPIALPPLYAGVTPESPSDHAQALAWFTAEHAVLLAMVERAADAGFGRHAWQLVWSAADFLDRRGYWHDQAAAAHTALDSARRLADRAGQALTHRHLGRAYTQVGRYDDALGHYRQALDLHHRLGDPTEQATTHHHIGSVLQRLGRYQEALDHAWQALELCRAAGYRPGQGYALNAVGWFHVLLGEHVRALTYCEQARDLLQETGNTTGEAGTWHSLGLAHHHLGRYQEAASCYQQAIELTRFLGDRYHEAKNFGDLGDTLHALGDTAAARRAWGRALDILDELHHPEVDRMRARLLD
jgi:tetratricopeptide (TPR) repeat protein